MSLSQMRSEGGDTQSKAPIVNTTFGAVLNVATAREVEGGLELTGRTLTSCSRMPADTEVTVRFRGENAGRALTNFAKGNGKAALATPEKSAGTFVTLESCYIVEGEQDGDRPVLSARWLNTLASNRNDDHANRSLVENILATAPRLMFPNPSVQSGEPKSITLPVNAPKIRAKAESDGKTHEFSRDWALGKLKQLPANTKVQVVIDTLEPTESKKVDSIEQLKATLREQLARGTKAVSMIRVFDGNEAATRLLYVPFKKEGADYLPDVDKALDDLFKYNVISGIPNERLAAAIDGRELIAEVIPGYRMTYAGDSTKDDNAAYKLVTDVRDGKAGRYEVLFGKDPNHYAKVILTGIARNETIDGFSPISTITHEPGIQAPEAFATPHIQPRPAASPDEPSADAEEEPEAPRP